MGVNAEEQTNIMYLNFTDNPYGKTTIRRAEMHNRGNKGVPKQKHRTLQTKAKSKRHNCMNTNSYTTTPKSWGKKN